MNQKQTDQALRIIHTWAHFEYEQIESGNVNIESIKRTFRAIANKAAMALDRKDLVIK